MRKLLILGLFLVSGLAHAAQITSYSTPCYTTNGAPIGTCTPGASDGGTPILQGGNEATVTPGGALQVTTPLQPGQSTAYNAVYVIQSLKYVNLSASTAVKSGAGFWGQFMCTTAGTVTIYDNTAGSGTVLFPATSVTAGTYYGPTIPLQTAAGVFVVISGGAVCNFEYL